MLYSSTFLLFTSHNSVFLKSEWSTFGTLLLCCLPWFHVRGRYPRLSWGTPGLCAWAHEWTIRPWRIRSCNISLHITVLVCMCGIVFCSRILEHWPAPRCGAFLPFPWDFVPCSICCWVAGMCISYMVLEEQFIHILYLKVCRSCINRTHIRGCSCHCVVPQRVLDGGSISSSWYLLLSSLMH